MKPRITYVTYRLDPASGLERACVEIIDRLSSRYESTVVVLRGEPSDDFKQKLDSSRLITGIAAIAEARRALGSADPVVVCGIWAAAAIRAAGLTSIGQWSNVIHWEHSLLTTRLEADRRFRIVLRAARPTIQRARSVVCVSAGVAASVSRHIGANTPRVVLSNIVEVDQIGSPAVSRCGPRPAGPVTLLGVGSLRALKNYQLAIRSMAELPLDYELTLLGDGPERNALEKLASRLGVDDRVTFAGHVSTVGTHLASADVLVHPSLAETFGLSLLEAAAHDLPVVTLDVSAIDEVVPEFVPGTRVGSRDPSDFAAAIVRTVTGDHVHREAFDRARVARRETFWPPVTLSGWAEVLEGQG